MVETTVKVLNKAGIHARPSQQIVRVAERFYSEIFLVRDSDSFKANAKSIFNVMSLAAEYGSDLALLAEGSDEEEAVEAIAELFETKFKEE